MKTISGSILILAAAVLMQPAAGDQHRLDEAIVYAAPVFLFGAILLIIGLKTKS